MIPAPPKTKPAAKAADGPDDKLVLRFAAWAERMGPSKALVALVTRYMRAGRALRTTPFGAAIVRLATGRDPKAVDDALALLAREADPCRRALLRAIAAAAAASADRARARGFFDPALGWSAEAAPDAASAVFYADLSGATQPWEAAMMASIEQGPLRRARPAALYRRISIATRSGLAPAERRALFAAAFATRDRSGRMIARRLATLVWAFDAQSQIQPLFARFPGLVESGEAHPVIARLLRLGAWHRAPAARRPAIRALGDRIVALERGSAAFWTRLADPKLRVAVVGNSPCEIGRGLGAEIDAHDLVVRFNKAPEDGAFAADYGSRVDVKMYALRSRRAGVLRTRAPTIVSRQLHVVGDRLAFADEVAALGKTLVFASNALNQRLTLELGAQPSAGILFLAQLDAARGSLKGVSRYGFSLTDQVAETPSTTHYFDSTRPGGHAWRAERALFDSWTADR